MTISRDQVRHVALLSRLELSEDELDTYTGHLGGILAYVEKLNELDTAQVEPTSHPIRLSNVLRPGDTVAPSLPVEDALANAPETSGPFFKVPKVTE